MFCFQSNCDGSVPKSSGPYKTANKLINSANEGFFRQSVVTLHASIVKRGVPSWSSIVELVAIVPLFAELARGTLCPSLASAIEHDPINRRAVVLKKIQNLSTKTEMLKEDYELYF